ncbi:effector-associated domain EAD1-containing protein [Janthinobacterium sp. PLB04]|nr:MULTISPECIES: effector-associated domain EAD1-containing protein [Janthinobacterium]UGQ34418.1 effector-associated domain EAD1-containing protein [Janthinobacterium sp. PLB04]
MRIHKAWYGPKGGHSLLSSTEPSLQTVFRQAAWLTDLPGNAPTGLQWQPYFRTAISEGYFVLIYTRSSRDTTRAGMVDSVAAFIPLSELPLVPDFAALANNLRESQDSVERTPFEATAEAYEPPVNIKKPLLLELAGALISGRPLPAIHVGQSGFDDIMLSLLQVVPRPMRREILFSLSFTVEDSVPCAAVAIPTELASRYPQKQLLSASDNPLSTGVAALLNMPEGRPLLDFGEAVAFDLRSASSLILLEQAFRLWKNPDGVSDAIGLVRLLAAKSGDSQQASEVRQSALDRLVKTSFKWRPTDVLSMRNLQLERFDANRLSNTLKDWIRNRVDELNVTDDDCQLFDQAVRGAAQQVWWNTDVLAGYTDTIKPDSLGIGCLAWETIDKHPESLLPVLNLFDAKGHLDGLTNTVFLGLSTATIDAVAEESAKRGAWQLCGIALATRYGASRALLDVLKYCPPKTARHTAVESALSRAAPSELIEIAVREDIEEVTVLAADVVKNEPRLLRNFIWSSSVWFDILDKVIMSGSKVGNEIENRIQGLQTIIQRGERSERIWGALARAELADLLLVPNREHAWTLIPDSLVAKIVGQTAKAWLAAVLDSQVSAAAIEEPLRSEVRSALKAGPLMASLAKNAHLNFIKIIDTLYPVNDDECANLLDSLAHTPAYRFPPAPAAAIGKLIQSRKWTSAASRAASHSSFRDDFLVIAKECVGVMGVWDSWAVSFRTGRPGQISTDDAWKMFEESLSELYPHGPTDQEFWSRSGGKDNQLIAEGNGLAQWHRCIKQVRAGLGPSASDLLRIALRDFSGNLVLKMLRDSHVLE